MMEIDTIFKIIKKLGHSSSKREELRECCKSNCEQVLKFLPRRILNSDGANVLNCVLDGFAKNNKVKVIDIVLKTIRKEATSIAHSGDVVSRLCLELPRLPVEHLLRWCNDSVQSIVEDSDVNMIWRDIVPECLNVISSQEKVIHCGTEMTGAEYKLQCVHTLCQCRWQERHLVQLAAMFKDMQLPRIDHRQVVNKICSYIIDVHPDTLPPLVHQLLKLCKPYNLEVVLSHVSHYFNMRIYNKLEPPPQDSESTTMDIDDIVPYSPAELSRCLSTCLYHMSSGAEPEVLRRHLKAWPRTQLLRAPMLVNLALAVADKGADFRTVCLDTIKAAIEQREMDDIRCKEAAWVRSLLPPDVDVANLLKVLTNESANHRQLTSAGLISLAFSLLSVGRTKPVARACWSHGELILARLSRAQPETAPHVIAQLADRLADTPQPQHVDCLYVLCKLTPVAVERCPQLSGVLESCGDGAVYRAVRPLVPFSARVRDTVLMVCRKALYSRDSAHRQLAVWGFLTVLRHVKLSAGLSQSEPDSHAGASYFTQVAVDLHAERSGAAVSSRVRNETMCLEVVSILRRCLIQDAAVKNLLYTELYDCTKEKVSLHEAVLELLYEHLIKYLPDADDGPPILWEKCVQTTATNAVLIEPIGKLLYAVAQFLQPIQGEESDDMFSSQNENGSYLRNKLMNIMDKLCKSSLFSIGEMEDLGLTDLTPESKAKSLKVQQVLQCYEALIAHQVMQWTAENTNGGTLCRLFRECRQLLDNTKITSKGNKKGKLNDTKESVKSQKSQKSQKEKEKSQKEKGKATKLSNLVKDRAGPFKPLPCLWDLQLCLRFLHLLYSEEVTWSSTEQRNMVRTQTTLHVWAVRGVASCVQPVDRSHALDVLYVAALLHKSCLCRFQDICNFDDNTALAILELFKTCLDALFSQSYKLKAEKIFTYITGLQDSPVSMSVAEILEKIHTALVQLDADVGDERDSVAKKLIATLIAVATVLLDTPVLACSKLNAIIIKLEDYTRRSKQDCVPLIPPLLTAAFREHREVQFLDELMLKLTATLGLIDEDESSAEEDNREFPCVDERSGQTALTYVCTHLRIRARAIEHVLARARDLHAASNNAGQHQLQRIDKELREGYDDIVIQLCQLCRVTGGAARLRGAGDAAPAAVTRLYALLATLARQLPPHMAVPLRLERLLKLCGKKLSSICDSLITYCEASGGRATKTIPRLVLEAEHFSKNIILLEKKAKTNYQQYMSLGTARDFRIKGPVLQEVLGAIEQQQEAEREIEDPDITDAETEVLSAASDREDGSDDDTTSKRRRLS
ncbi:Fanconi anemia group I protein homolog [Aricia agestis]|uniref:Fanconi anemia group I protein homolog n=1 Tax=Aricia agestis TaxID=91739 RepID=UPI001C20ABB3|nr:Fanconi anemia group I protein homolog [Aricia agestis]